MLVVFEHNYYQHTVITKLQYYIKAHESNCSSSLGLTNLLTLTGPFTPLLGLSTEIENSETYDLSLSRLLPHFSFKKSSLKIPAWSPKKGEDFSVAPIGKGRGLKASSYEKFHAVGLMYPLLPAFVIFKHALQFPPGGQLIRDLSACTSSMLD